MWGAAGQAAPPVVLDHIVAVVDKEVLTDSQLQVEARLSLAWREGPAAAWAHLTPEAFAALRDWVVQQMLIAGQARRLGAEPASDEEVAARTAALAQRFESPARYAAFCARFNLAPATVRAIMARDARNERYVEQRMRTRLLGAGDGQAVDPDRYASALQAWSRELRQGAEVRLEAADGRLELERVR
jgi:hypothetical protein